MKNIVIISILLLYGQAMATQITMTDPQEEHTDNGKTLCIYSNAQYTFTYMAKYHECPYAKTFYTGDADE